MCQFLENPCSSLPHHEPWYPSHMILDAETDKGYRWFSMRKTWTICFGVGCTHFASKQNEAKLDLFCMCFIFLLHFNFFAWFCLFPILFCFIFLLFCLVAKQANSCLFLFPSGTKFSLWFQVLLLKQNKGTSYFGVLETIVCVADTLKSRGGVCMQRLRFTIKVVSSSQSLLWYNTDEYFNVL